MTNDEWGARNINPCALVFGRLREEIGQKKSALRGARFQKWNGDGRGPQRIRSIARERLISLVILR